MGQLTLGGAPEDEAVEVGLHLELLEDGEHGDGVRSRDERSKQQRLQQAKGKDHAQGGGGVHHQPHY